MSSRSHHVASSPCCCNNLPATSKNPQGTLARINYSPFKFQLLWHSYPVSDLGVASHELPEGPPTVLLLCPVHSPLALDLFEVQYEAVLGGLNQSGI